MTSTDIPSFSTVRVPCLFPVANRRIHVTPIASMTAKTKATEYPRMAYAVSKVIERHQDERILVHTVSYDLARYLLRVLYTELGAEKSRLLMYESANDRDKIVERYREREGSVLLAPSLERGVDFKGDDCRVVVVAKVPFPNLGDRQVNARLHSPGGPLWYCTSPDTRVLTADLHWVEAAKVSTGDRLVAFDEEGPWRRWRTAEVEGAGYLTRPCYRFHMTDGTTLVSSSEHRWLIRTSGTQQWRTTEQIAKRAGKDKPHKLIRLLDTWDEDRSWDAGYLAATFDGEGYLSQRGGAEAKLQLSYSQRPNAMSAQVSLSAEACGFRITQYENTRDDCLQHSVLGGRPEVLRFLGQIRPRRLLANMDFSGCGSLFYKDLVTVAEAEFIGEQEVYGMRTSTGTFVAEGFASHNSVGTVRSLVQMTGRGVRSETDHCTSYILDRQFTDNVWKKSRALLPTWWVEALDMTAAYVKEFTGEFTGAHAQVEHHTPGRGRKFNNRSLTSPRGA